MGRGPLAGSALSFALFTQVPRREEQQKVSNQPNLGAGVGTAYGLEHRSVIAALATAGIGGPFIFAVVALVHSLLRPDHSLLRHPVSALAAGPSGWVQNVNFLLFGLLMIAYAMGLHLGVRPTRWGLVGVMFLVLSGVGLMWGGVFPATDDTGAFDGGRLLHIPGFVMTFLGGGIGLVLMFRRMESSCHLRAGDRRGHAGAHRGGWWPGAASRSTAARVVWAVPVGVDRGVVAVHGGPRAQIAGSGQSGRCAALSGHYYGGTSGTCLQHRGAGASTRPGSSFYPYSPECVEGEFSEVAAFSQPSLQWVRTRE